MATTYNNLYLDLRRSFRMAGIEAAALEARELRSSSGRTSTTISPPTSSAR